MISSTISLKIVLQVANIFNKKKSDFNHNKNKKFVTKFEKYIRKHKVCMFFFNKCHPPQQIQYIDKNL